MGRDRPARPNYNWCNGTYYERRLHVPVRRRSQHRPAGCSRRRPLTLNGAAGRLLRVPASDRPLEGQRAAHRARPDASRPTRRALKSGGESWYDLYANLAEYTADFAANPNATLATFCDLSAGPVAGQPTCTRTDPGRPRDEGPGHALHGHPADRHDRQTLGGSPVRQDEQGERPSCDVPVREIRRPLRSARRLRTERLTTSLLGAIHAKERPHGLVTADPRLQPHPYADFVHRVEKPARYLGGEYGAARKDWDAPQARICLAFPDVYDIGMSHLGFKILYKILNDDPRTLADRAYAPWIDMERELRARKLPLVSLEAARPLKDFDVVGFSLQFELT